MIGSKQFLHKMVGLKDFCMKLAIRKAYQKAEPSSIVETRLAIFKHFNNADIDLMKETKEINVVVSQEL